MINERDARSSNKPIYLKDFDRNAKHIGKNRSCESHKICAHMPRVGLLNDRWKLAVANWCVQPLQTFFFSGKPELRLWFIAKLANGHFSRSI